MCTRRAVQVSSAGRKATKCRVARVATCLISFAPGHIGHDEQPTVMPVTGVQCAYQIRSPVACSSRYEGFF